jgi:hypothetical protein
MSGNINACQRPQTMQMTEERTKEIIIETLIELGLVSQPQRRKLMSDV